MFKILKDEGERRRGLLVYVNKLIHIMCIAITSHAPPVFPAVLGHGLTFASMTSPFHPLLALRAEPQRLWVLYLLECLVIPEKFESVAIDVSGEGEEEDYSVFVPIVHGAFTGDQASLSSGSSGPAD